MPFDNSINYDGPIEANDRGTPNLGNSQYVQYGTLANRMDAGNKNVVYVDDTGDLWRDTGTAWERIGSVRPITRGNPSDRPTDPVLGKMHVENITGTLGGRGLSTLQVPRAISGGTEWAQIGRIISSGSSPHRSAIFSHNRASRISLPSLNFKPYLVRVEIAVIDRVNSARETHGRACGLAHRNLDGDVTYASWSYHDFNSVNIYTRFSTDYLAEVRMSRGVLGEIDRYSVTFGDSSIVIAVTDSNTNTSPDTSLDRSKQVMIIGEVLGADF